LNNCSHRAVSARAHFHPDFTPVFESEGSAITRSEVKLTLA